MHMKTKKSYPYEKPYLKYQLTISLQKMKKFHIFTSVLQPILPWKKYSKKIIKQSVVWKWLKENQFWYYVIERLHV